MRSALVPKNLLRMARTGRTTVHGAIASVSSVSELKRGDSVQDLLCLCVLIILNMLCCVVVDAARVPERVSEVRADHREEACASSSQE